MTLPCGKVFVQKIGMHAHYLVSLNMLQGTTQEVNRMKDIAKEYLTNTAIMLIFLIKYHALDAEDAAEFVKLESIS